MTITREQARLILQAHDISEMLDNEEEFELLEANNPALAQAYFALYRMAYSAAVESPK